MPRGFLRRRRLVSNTDRFVGGTRMAHVRSGSNSEVELADADFRFAPDSGLKSDITRCPKSADIVAKVFLRGGTQILRPVGATIE
jgi:hypothetical protein